MQALTSVQEAPGILCPYVRPTGLIDYHDPATGKWVERATTIPERALAALPDGVRRHTERRMERYCK